MYTQSEVRFEHTQKREEVEEEKNCTQIYFVHTTLNKAFYGQIVKLDCGPIMNLKTSKNVRRKRINACIKNKIKFIYHKQFAN